MKPIEKWMQLYLLEWYCVLYIISPFLFHRMKVLSLVVFKSLLSNTWDSLNVLVYLFRSFLCYTIRTYIEEHNIFDILYYESDFDYLKYEMLEHIYFAKKNTMFSKHNSLLLYMQDFMCESYLHSVAADKTRFYC